MYTPELCRFCAGTQSVHPKGQRINLLKPNLSYMLQICASQVLAVLGSSVSRVSAKLGNFNVIRLLHMHCRSLASQPTSMVEANI